jgi:plasmid stability protein
LTVRNLDDDVVRRLRIRAAEQSTRQQIAARLAEFRHRTAGRGSPTSGELLEQSRAARMKSLTGADEAG